MASFIRQIVLASLLLVLITTACDSPAPTPTPTSTLKHTQIPPTATPFSNIPANLTSQQYMERAYQYSIEGAYQKAIDNYDEATRWACQGKLIKGTLEY